MNKKSQSNSGGESKIEETEAEKPAEESEEKPQEEQEEQKPEDSSEKSGEKKSGEYRIKETEEDVDLGSEKDTSPDALKEEIKKEAEKSDVFMKYLAPTLVFLLVGGAVSAATWYYAKPERANSNATEKIQTPPEVKEEPTTTPPAATTQPATPAPTPQPQVQTYTVKTGDTMSTIANANGLTSQELATYNGITDVNSLHIGQVLKIPAK